LTFSSCTDLSKKPEKLPKTEQYEKLIGKWKLINSNFLPFKHPSFCEKLEKLELNSIFEFDEYGILKVYQKGKTKRNCNELQAFWIEKNELVLFDAHVGFRYEIIKLTSDSLRIKTEQVPLHIIENENMNEKLKFIEKNGIILTFEKIKNVRQHRV
tara:strand:- start:31 stop:498 length:468 start_codon:yes stop_codon:yes gene_type:complete